MIIKLPAFCGTRTNHSIYKKVDVALKKSEDIDIDCAVSVFTTNGFVWFLKNLEKKVFAHNSTLTSKDRKVQLALINVSEEMYDPLHTCQFDQLIPIKTRRSGKNVRASIAAK
jgi:hypothetical protein